MVLETNVCPERCGLHVRELQLMCTISALPLSSCNCVDPKQPMHLFSTIHAHIYESSTTIGGVTSNTHGHLIVSHHASIWSQSAVTAHHTHFTSPRHTHLLLRFSCALHCTRQDPDLFKHSTLLSYSAAKHIIIHMYARSLNMTRHLLLHRR